MASQFYKYRWEIKFQIPSRNIEFLPLFISSIKKNCDYINNFIPNYELNVKILDQDLEILRMFDKELVVNIKQTVLYGSSREDLTEKKIVFEDTFIPFYDKGLLSNASRDFKTVKDGEDTFPSYDENRPNASSAVRVHLNLLLKKDLQMKKYLHNYILGTKDSPVTPGSAVAFVIDQNPYIEKYIMDKPDNTSTYQDMIIKPNELKDAIRQIQVNYGIYGKDIEIFYDNGILYILNKYEREHSYQKDEMTLVNVLVDTRPSVINNVDIVEINEDKKTINYERCGSIKIDDKEAILGEMVGDKVVFSNFNTAINSMFGSDGETSFVSPLNEIERPTQSNVNTGTKIIPDYDMINNPWLMASKFYSTNLGVPIMFAISSVNSEHFGPNKRVYTSFKTSEENKLYAGTYNIAKANFIYKNVGEVNLRYDTYCHVGLELINPEKVHNANYEAPSAE